MKKFYLALMALLIIAGGVGCGNKSSNGQADPTKAPPVVASDSSQLNLITLSDDDIRNPSGPPGQIMPPPFAPWPIVYMWGNSSSASADGAKANSKPRVTYISIGFVGKNRQAVTVNHSKGASKTFWSDDSKFVTLMEKLINKDDTLTITPIMDGGYKHVTNTPYSGKDSSGNASKKSYKLLSQVTTYSDEKRENKVVVAMEDNSCHNSDQ